MKTQGKNQLTAILGAQKSNNSMMCSFRCDRDLWKDFSVLCALNGKDKTAEIVEHIQHLVKTNSDKIKAYKDLKG